MPPPIRTVWALASVVGFGMAGAPDARAADGSLKVGQPAPIFRLPMMNAAQQQKRSFNLRDLVGPEAKTPRRVVLNFAASYCGPCRRELAELKARARALDPRQVVLAVVVIDTEKEGIETMRRLTIDELALPFPVLADRFGVLARRYGATSLPMSVVIDARGRVRWVQSGYEKGSVDRLFAKAGITHRAVRAARGVRTP